MINANLCPEKCVKKYNLLVTAIISDPKEPKNFNSFMHPIVCELKELESIIMYFNNSYRFIEY